MPQRNEYFEVALNVADRLRSMKEEAERVTAIPFGMEKLSARDHARRVFESMSPQDRVAEFERVGRDEMAKVARTYQKYRVLPSAMRSMKPLYLPGREEG